MIYAVIEAGDNSAVKIGYTATANDKPNVAALLHRMRSLQCGNPRPLICVSMAPGSMAGERTLHRLFRAHLIAREWFHNRDSVAIWVAQHAVEPIDLNVVAPFDHRMTNHTFSRNRMQRRKYRDRRRTDEHHGDVGTLTVSKIV